MTTVFEQRLDDFIGSEPPAKAAAALGVDSGILLFWPFAMPDSALNIMAEPLKVSAQQIRGEFFTLKSNAKTDGRTHLPRQCSKWTTLRFPVSWMRCPVFFRRWPHNTVLSPIALSPLKPCFIRCLLQLCSFFRPTLQPYEVPFNLLWDPFDGEANPDRRQ